MRESYYLLHQHEIILDKPSLDEGTLVGGDHCIQVASQSVGQDFGRKFGKAVHKANGPEILHLISLCFFWNQRNISRV